MLGWWNHGSSTLGWSRLQGCSRDHQDDKSTFTMNSSWLGSPIAQRYLQYPDDRKSGLSIVLVPLEKGGAHFRTHERHDFHLQRKGVVEAKDVRFPPQLKWIETVGQKIGICEMQCCSDMVRYIYIHMIIYIYIYINLDIYILIYIYMYGFSFDLAMLRHDWRTCDKSEASSFKQAPCSQNHPFYGFVSKWVTLQIAWKWWISVGKTTGFDEMHDKNGWMFLQVVKPPGTATFLWDE